LAAADAHRLQPVAGVAAVHPWLGRGECAWASWRSCSPGSRAAACNEPRCRQLLLFAQPWRIPAEFLTEQHALCLRAGQLEASTAMARALFDANGQREVLLDQLPTLAMPTLVAWGASDYVLPAHQAQTAVALLPRGRLSVFPDCRHLPHVERPEQFVAVLGDWLNQDHDTTPQLRLGT
jgi:pimeloyl-ACP methyl ester carboxylesterase